MYHLGLSIRYFILLSICTLCLLTSCEQELGTEDIFSEETELAVTFNPDREKLPPTANAIYIARSTEAFQKLIAWFHTHNGTWKRDDDFSFNQAISIRGAVLQIDIHDTFIRIGFNNPNGHFRQYWTSCDLTDFDFLMDLKK